MNELFYSNKIRTSVEKIINQYDTSVFIFHGLEGIGKRSFANTVCNKILKSDNNDENFNENTISNDKDIAQKSENLFFNNTHPDAFILEETDGKSIKIDQVRELKSFINETPSISTNKVVIIDPIEQLTLNATNTLLKNLEETNYNTYIFLISHNLDRVLKTIQSRVFKFYFKPISKDKFTSILKLKNNFNLNDEELILVKNLFNFSPGLYLKFYNKNDQLLEDYTQFISNILDKKLFEKNSNDIRKIDISLRLMFLNNFIKNILCFFTDKNFNNKTINFEKDIINSLNLNSVLIDKIYNEYNIFQELLDGAVTYNSSIDDLLEIFIHKINL